MTETHLNQAIEKGPGRTRSLFSLELALVVAASVLAFVNTIPNDFTYDDTFLVVKNPVIRDGLELARPASWVRHVKTLTLAMDYRLWGLSPHGYHLTNVILHSLVCGLVFVLGLRLSGSHKIAGGAGLVFALHPVHVEAVAAISNRGDPLAALFAIGAILSLLRARSASVRWVSFLTLTALAALSKETIGVVVPALAVATVFHFCKGTLAERAARALPGIVVLLAEVVGAAVFVFSGRVQERFTGEFIQILTKGGAASYGELLMTEIAAVAGYVRLLFWPSPLCVFQPRAIVHTPAAPGFALALALILLGGLLAVLLRKRSPLVSFGIFWFGLCLSPVLNLVPVNQYLLAERYLYFPSIGFSLAVCQAAFDVAARVRRRRAAQAALVLAVFAVTGLFSLLTVRGNAVWFDNRTLWSDAAAKVPDSASAANGLGAAYYDLGLVSKAAESFQDALRADPGYVKALDNLARCYAQTGQRLGEAEELLRRAMVSNPGHYHALSTMAEVAYRRGEIDKAIELVQEAIKLDKGTRSLDSFKHYEDEYQLQLDKYLRARSGRLDGSRESGPTPEWN